MLNLQIGRRTPPSGIFEPYRCLLHYRHPGSPIQVAFGSHHLTWALYCFPEAYQGTDGDTYPIPSQEFILRNAYNY